MRLHRLPAVHPFSRRPSAIWTGTGTWPPGTARRRSRTGSPSPAGRITTCGYWWRRSYPEQKKTWPVLRHGGESLGTRWPGYSLCTPSIGRMCSLGWDACPEYIFSHEPKRRPDCIYFSLGDKEAKTRNPVLKTVQENTEEIQTFYQNKGIDTVFQLNPGNHFVQGIERTIAGIQWLLSK